MPTTTADAHAQQDLLPPEQLRDQDAVVQALNATFVARLLSGYMADGESVSPPSQRKMGMRCESDGLWWTSDDRLVVPGHDNLQSDCIECVHAHPLAGHYGVTRTLKNLQKYFTGPA